MYVYSFVGVDWSKWLLGCYFGSSSGMSDQKAYEFYGLMESFTYREESSAPHPSHPPTLIPVTIDH